jgi:hypothetical protein
VNAFNDNDQSRPSVAAFQSSGYVIVWQSAGQDASGYGVFARAFLPNNEFPGVLTLRRGPSAGAVTVDFTGQPGHTYQLQRSSNLMVWSPILTVTSPVGMLQYTEPATNAHQFYRVQSP